METSWFPLAPRLNLIEFSDEFSGARFLQTIETINPPYDCQIARPFRDLPRKITQSGYTRLIDPSKRTISMGVFGATPPLVSDLGVLNELLYETDRIEAGRRLDYSRWLNFVELASSTRWSEVSDNFKIIGKLVRQSQGAEACSLTKITAGLSASDRITGDLMNQLIQWLKNLPTTIKIDQTPLINATLLAILRAKHFKAARDLVDQRLPLIVHIGQETSKNLLQFAKAQIKLHMQHSQQPDIRRVKQLQSCLKKQPTCHLDSLKISIRMARTLSKLCFKTEPILLYNSQAKHSSKEFYPEIVDHIYQCSQHCQTIFCFNQTNLFTNGQISTIHKAKNLTIATSY